MPLDRYSPDWLNYLFGKVYCIDSQLQAKIIREVLNRCFSFLPYLMANTKKSQPYKNAIFKLAWFWAWFIWPTYSDLSRSNFFDRVWGALGSIPGQNKVWPWKVTISGNIENCIFIWWALSYAIIFNIGLTDTPICCNFRPWNIYIRTELCTGMWRVIIFCSQQTLKSK